MKRDMDYIRDLLLKLEKYPYPRGGGDKWQDVFKELYGKHFSKLIFTDDEPELNTFEYHFELLNQKQLIYGMGGRFQGLTWDGNDYLDSIRDDDVWKKTKLKELSGIEL